MARRYSSFQHVAENLARTFYGEAENCIEHPGYKYRKFETFEELDAYFKDQFGADWREQPWAKYWIRSHNREEANAYNRDQLHDRGKKFRQRVPGSVRDIKEKRGFRQITRQVPKHILVALLTYYVTEGYQSLRQLEAVMLAKENIEIDKDTIRRLLNKEISKRS